MALPTFLENIDKGLVFRSQTWIFGFSVCEGESGYRVEGKGERQSEYWVKGGCERESE